MSERRMLSSQIIESDAFLDLPLSAQALYMHLNINADDEGFINSPKRVQRMIGASANDLALLYEKRFLLQFESGATVVKHWLINNTIRSDRKKNTVYTAERSQLKIKPNGAYTLATGGQSASKPQPLDNHLTTKWQPSDNQTATNPQPNDRINKDNINKSNIERENACAREETDREILERSFRDFWNEYPKKQNESAACRAWISLAPSPELAAEIIKAVKENKKRNAEWKRNGGRYIPKAENWLFDQRWRDEISEEKDEEADKGKAAGDDYYNDEFFEKFVERKRAERKKREEELKNETSTNEGNVGRAE